MALLSKEQLLSASDLEEEEVELPSIGGSVRVRALPAAYSNQASSEAMKMVTDARGEQIATVDTSKMEILQALHGLVDPKLSSEAEAQIFATKCGPAFKKVIAAIDRLSGVDKEAIENAEARFPAGAGSANGATVEVPDGGGNGGPTVPVRAGVGVENAD